MEEENNVAGLLKTIVSTLDHINAQMIVMESRMDALEEAFVQIAIRQGGATAGKDTLRKVLADYATAKIQEKLAELADKDMGLASELKRRLDEQLKRQEGE